MGKHLPLHQVAGSRVNSSSTVSMLSTCWMARRSVLRSTVMEPKHLRWAFHRIPQIMTPKPKRVVTTSQAQRAPCQAKP